MGLTMPTALDNGQRARGRGQGVAARLTRFYGTRPSYGAVSFWKVDDSLETSTGITSPKGGP
jgi:hypothetical protein